MSDKQHKWRARYGLMDMVNDAIFGVRGGRIVYWNGGAERLYGWSQQDALGQTAEDLLRSELPMPRARMWQFLSQHQHWQGEFFQTKQDGTRILVASRWSLWRNAKGKPLGWVEINTDISKQRKAEQNIRQLTGSLLQLQDGERRRLARELHDSTGQLLFVLGMELAMVEGEAAKLSAEGAKALADAVGLVQEVKKEIRTISHVLHPPLIDETGLACALRTYVEGFTERSNINVEFDMSAELKTLSKDMEMAIFRLVQECLTNIHRHSGSSAAKVCIARGTREVRVEVQDQGKGIPAGNLLELQSGRKSGVGMRGIRERLRQFGGSFEIESDTRGTRVLARLPLPEMAVLAGTERLAS